MPSVDAHYSFSTGNENRKFLFMYFAWISLTCQSRIDCLECLPLGRHCVPSSYSISQRSLPCVSSLSCRLFARQGFVTRPDTVHSASRLRNLHFGPIANRLSKLPRSGYNVTWISMCVGSRVCPVPSFRTKSLRKSFTQSEGGITLLQNLQRLSVTEVTLSTSSHYKHDMVP